MKRGIAARLLATMLSTVLVLTPNLAVDTQSSVKSLQQPLPLFVELAIVPSYDVSFPRSLVESFGIRRKREVGQTWHDEFDLTRIVTTINLDPEQELRVLEHVLTQLENELETPGSAQMPKVVAISDQHGGVDRFDALVLDAMKSVLPDKTFPSQFKDPSEGFESYADQLKPYDIVLSDFQGKLFFHLLGDMMHRGDYGYRVFQHCDELYNAGIADVITGNHDILEWLSSEGYHLPFYEGYETYGYRDRWGSVDELLREQWRMDPGTRTPGWWAEKLADFQSYQDAQQKERWKKYDNEIKVLYATVSESIKNNPARTAVWNQLRGWYLVNIYVGTRAAGSMSVNWWVDLQNQFENECRQVQKSGASQEVKNAWLEANQLIQKMISQHQEDLAHHVEAGEWWWRVFEALNYGNYRTPEWYAKDSAYHKDWGPAVFAELSKILGGPSVTNRNYIDDERIKKVAAFVKKTYTISLRDIYQNHYQHSFLPVDLRTREFFFTYKGVEYRGRGRSGPDGYPSFEEGAKRVEQDIRALPLSELQEALTLVISWYGDMTTKTKPPDIAAALSGPEGKGGIQAFMKSNGMPRFWNGHVPHDKFDDDDRFRPYGGFNVGDMIFNLDTGMSPYYGRRGGAAHITPNGISYRGFEHAKSDVIIDNPRTVVLSKEGVEGVLFNNKGVSRENFLPSLIQQVKERIRELRRVMRLGQGFTQQSITFHDESEAA